MSATKLLFLYKVSSGGAYNATVNYLKELKNRTSQKTIACPIKTHDELWRVKNKRRLRLVKSVLSLFRATLSSLKKIKLKEIDAVYSPSWLILLVLFFAKPKVKLFYHYHGEHFQDWEKRIRDIQPFYKKYFYALPFYLCLSIVEKLITLYFKKVFVPSNYSKEQFLSLFPAVPSKKVIIVPYGINKKIFYPKKEGRSKYLKLLFAGRLDPNKGLSELLKALESLDDKIKCKFTAVFISTDLLDYKEEVLKKLKSLRNAVEICWDLEPKKLSNIYRNSDLTILPSHFEQLPLVFLESISCGTPVLSTKVGELKKLQPQISKKLLLRNSKPRSIAQGILWFNSLTYKEKQKIRKRCIKLSSPFSWNNAAKIIYESIFEQV